jgi:hypothetical protein
MRALLFLLALVPVLAGCSHVTSSRQSTLDTSRYRHFYVERSLTDNHRIHELIVAELLRQGRQASSGPLTMKPQDVDAIITYTDRWAWDFKTYLIELTIAVRDGRTDKTLATGRYYQPSIKTKAPPALIKELLAPLLAADSSPSKF